MELDLLRVKVSVMRFRVHYIRTWVKRDFEVTRIYVVLFGFVSSLFFGKEFN